MDIDNDVFGAVFSADRKKRFFPYNFLYSVNGGK